MQTGESKNMIDNFKAVYRILSSLEEQMDKLEVNVSKFDYEQLGITGERWIKYIEMMQDVGYIKGCSIYTNVNDEMISDTTDIKITLRGLEYLQENSIMQRIYKATKGIKDII